ncbi:MAG: ankyrin repeat domain-containing protein [Rickettsiales bacterium]|nr:ankyrin repeat domain-containing protein [Rickettsiales bacterium]
MTSDQNITNVYNFIEKISLLGWSDILMELTALNEKQEKTVERIILNNFLNKILAKDSVEADLDIKNKCIDLLFQLGSEPNLNNHLWGVKTLFAHYEAVKRYIEQGDKRELAFLLLKRCFSFLEKTSEEQALLVKLAFEYIADFTEEDKVLSINTLHNSLENLKKAGLNKHQLLQLFFKTYTNTSEEGDIIQKEVVSYLLQEGIEMSELQLSQRELQLSTATMLIDEYGLDPNILLLVDCDTLSYYRKTLDLFEHYNIKMSSFFFIVKLHSMEEELDNQLIERTIKNLSFKVDEPIDVKKTIEAFEKLGPQFQEYLEHLSQDINIHAFLKTVFVENGSLIHYFAKNNKISFLEYILNSNSYNVNVVNDLGQTPLFHAASPQIADLLIKNGVDIYHKDNKHKTWIYTTTSVAMVEYALEHNFIVSAQTDDFVRMYLVEGNFEHAAALSKKHFESGLNLLDNFIQIIITGLKESIENNKYQAIIHLIEKAGITIPEKYQYLLNTFNDDTKEEDYDFIYGLVHKLAQHYIHLVKTSFFKSISEENSNTKMLVDKAFTTLNFSELKDLYPDNALLSQITDDFSAYALVLSKVSSLITNDIALEIMVLNGLRPAIVNFNESVNLYRGMKLTLSEEDIKSYFTYGHQAFVNSNNRHKLLGFNVNQPWNKITNAHWEYGGTYFSLDSHTAADFAAGMTSGNKAANSLLIESRFDNNIPKFCGSYTHEYEIISSNVPGNNIIALYTLNVIKSQGIENYQISEVIKNPYISEAISPRYKVGDNVTRDQDGKELYQSLCQDLPTKNEHSALYTNTEDFVSRYSKDQFIDDQKWLFNKYFSGRDMFEDECIVGNINLLEECEL